MTHDLLEAGCEGWIDGVRHVPMTAELMPQRVIERGSREFMFEVSQNLWEYALTRGGKLVSTLRTQ